MTRPILYEDDLQRAVAGTLAAVLLPSVLWFHVPNGGLRNKVVAGKMKAMGVRRGVADCYFAWQDDAGVARTGWIELKVGKNTLEPEQKDFRDWVLGMGHLWAEARSIDAVLEILKLWRVPNRLA